MDNPDDEITTEQANRILIDRYGAGVHAALYEHGKTCKCADPVRHLLQTPTLRVIEGGAA